MNIETTLTPQKFFHWLIFQSRRNRYDENGAMDNSLAVFLGPSFSISFKNWINFNYTRFAQPLPRWAALYSITTYYATNRVGRKLTSVECTTILFTILLNEWRRARG